MKNETAPEEYLKRFEEKTKIMLDITRAKNNDYSWSQFAFKNFEQIEWITDWKISTADGILVRMTDKMSRIATLLNWEQQVADEKITDTLMDLSNYSIILSIYLETLKKED